MQVNTVNTNNVKTGLEIGIILCDQLSIIKKIVENIINII